MYYVYIIQSEKDKSFYIGYSSNLKNRLMYHNKGWSKSTKAKRLWKLMYYEAYEDMQTAKRREWCIKNNKEAKQELLSRLTDLILSPPGAIACNARKLANNS